MSTQKAIQLLLQALQELHGTSTEQTQVLHEVAASVEVNKKKPDRSRHPTSIYDRQISQLREAIISVQIDDHEANRAEPRTYEEMHEALLKNGRRELFHFADKTRQIDQLKRCKSKYSKRFGALRKHPGVFMVLQKLPKRNVVKMQPGTAT